MSTAYIGELRLMSFPFAPLGWAQCNGQPLPINQNQALFYLLGTTYGGDGKTNFAVPDLRGRTPMGAAQKLPRGKYGGEETHTLTLDELPVHSHPLQASGLDANGPSPGDSLLAGANNAYSDATDLVSLDPTSIAPAGGAQQHENRQPYTVLTWCISLQGVMPDPNR